MGARSSSASAWGPSRTAAAPEVNTTTALSLPRHQTLPESSPKQHEAPSGAAHAAHAVDEPEEVARFTRWSLQADGQRRGVSSFQLTGMHCAACAGVIEQAVAGLEGVDEVRVSASAQLATVRWDPARTRPSLLIEAIRQAGYGAAPDAAVAARELRLQEQRQALWRLFVSGFLAMQVMMMATPSYVAAPGELSDDLRQLLNWGSWVLSVPVLWFAGMPFLRGAWRAMQARRIGMDVPVALGLTVTFIASTGATFDPFGPFGSEVYFDSLTMFLAFLWLGRFLEMRSRHRAAERLESTANALPQTAARVDADGSTAEISVHRLRKGDRVRVPAGGVVPADGPLLSPGADVSEALITGESAAVRRAAGQTLWAGSVNLGPPFELQVAQLGADTRHEAIVALMREALSTRPASVRLADRWAGPFLWAVLALAGLSGLAWAFIEPARAVWVVVAVLIVTCPCALSLATPSTLVAAAGGLARRGVLLRRLDTLETLVGVRQVFLDKTGTLTEDRLELRQLDVLEPGTFASSAAALACAASLAAWSRHPLSRALVAAQEAAASQEQRSANTSTPGLGTLDAGDAQVRGEAPSWTGVVETPGAGLSGRDARGREWRLGAARWAEGADVAHAADDVANGEHRVQLACEGRPVARFEFEEFVRPAAWRRRRACAVSMRQGCSWHCCRATRCRVPAHWPIAWASRPATPACHLKTSSSCCARRRGRAVRLRWWAMVSTMHRCWRPPTCRWPWAMVHWPRARGLTPSSSRGALTRWLICTAAPAKRWPSCGRTCAGPLSTTPPAFPWPWPDGCPPGRPAWAWPPAPCW